MLERLWNTKSKNPPCGVSIRFYPILLWLSAALAICLLPENKPSRSEVELPRISADWQIA